MQSGSLRSRRRRQNRFAREVFHWPPSAGFGFVCSAHTQPRLRLIPECFPIANRDWSAGGGVIDAQPSGGRRLLCPLHDHERACFYGLADGGIIVEDEHFTCLLDRRTSGPALRRTFCEARWGVRGRRQHRDLEVPEGNVDSGLDSFATTHPSAAV